ncbi:protein N-terminal amidase, partial [Lecanoromycetidae sp. Uapishka_2]
MRIACLQFAPELGYNFPSLSSVLPYLEPTAAGHSTIWAKSTAALYGCIVTVGYPELYSPNLASSTDRIDPIIAYNSTVTVSPTGKVLAHYRKTHLYYTDETWAQESPERWLSTPLTFTPKTQPEKNVKASFGICMDLNPHKFTAPWEAYEFASHALANDAEILVLSMAWLTQLPAADLALEPDQPDLATLSYWSERLKPLVEGEEEVIAVFANRCGEEPGNNPLGEEEGHQSLHDKMKECAGKENSSEDSENVSEEPLWFLYDSLVTVLVGPDEQRFDVHKALLCKSSDFFNAALNGNFIEANGTVKLPEQNPGVFKYFVHWLYTGINWPQAIRIVKHGSLRTTKTCLLRHW